MKTQSILLAMILVVCMVFTCAVPALAYEPYKSQVTKVYTGGEEAGELTLRFYMDTPHVPYLGMSAYSEYMKNQPLSLRENGDGTCSLVNAIGAELLCDVKAGTIFVEDWGRFFDLPLPLEDLALGWKDTTTRFARITAVDYEDEATPVELDLAKYGIRIYADSDDIYLPVSILTNIMTDIAANYLIYNGESLFAERLDLNADAVEGFLASETLQAQLQGQDRPDDIIHQCYADLCFCFDHFYGAPGVAVLEEAIAEKGMDQALKDLEEEGETIREDLLSPDLIDYILAMERLFMVYLSDGHTVYMGMMTISSDPDVASNEQLAARLREDYVDILLNSPVTLRQVMHEAIPAQRQMVWGDDVYREYGATAIIRLDDFMPDEEAWDSYYRGEGPLPEDSLGIVISGLRKASENPEIENVILDLSCNAGGSPDVMMAILAMTTGQDQLYGLQKISGQRMTFTFEADSNLDGVFDERDKEIKYDFNYGVLVSRYAFSCGNLFPNIIQEGGAVLIGESSSGGSCCIQMGTDAEGLTFILSSAQWQLTDSQWVDVEDGCSVDLPIEPVSSANLDMLFAILGAGEGLPDFANYYDDAMLDEMMNDWYRTQASMDMAA